MEIDTDTAWCILKEHCSKEIVTHTKAVLNLVNKLAERSKIAADEIDILSKSSVDVTESSGKLMTELAPEIQKTSKLVQEITAASIEQNSGADQVNNAIQQLNQVTQQNAAASEEMATSSEELSTQAEQLKEIISFFKIDNSQKRMSKIDLMKGGNGHDKNAVYQQSKTTGIAQFHLIGKYLPELQITEVKT